MMELIKKIFNRFGDLKKEQKGNIPDLCIEEYTKPEELHKFMDNHSNEIPSVKYVNSFEPENPTLLIMDDHAGMVSLIVDELMSKINSIHVNIITASSDYAAFSVKEFINNPNHCKIDIAFLDISLGGICFEDNALIEMDGIDIAEMLWKDNPSAEIRFITGHTLAGKNQELHSFTKKFESMILNLDIKQSSNKKFTSVFEYFSRIDSNLVNRVAYNYIIHKSVNRLELMLFAIHKWYKRERECDMLGFQQNYKG